MADDHDAGFNAILKVDVPTFMADLIEYVDRSKESQNSRSGSAETTGEGVFGVDEEGRLRPIDKEDKVQWMGGKTVVLYGDSVQRYNLDHFCKVSPKKLDLVVYILSDTWSDERIDAVYASSQDLE